MRQVTKLSSVLSAVQLEEPLRVKVAGGISVTLGQPGDWVLFNDKNELKKVIDDAEYRESYTQVLGE
jgi:hypothetical protein